VLAFYTKDTLDRRVFRGGSRWADSCG